jgi:hypothetical protein
MEDRVWLGRGRHRSPAHGACVMELASLLAGEPFSDRPRCVDPVIGAFLRAFNDRLGHVRRQELRPYAAAVLHTADNRRVTRARRERCLRFAAGGEVPGLGTRARLALLLGLPAALRPNVGAAEWAAREAVIRDDELGFALLDDLLADGGVASPRAVTLRPLEPAPPRTPAVPAAG